MSDKLKKIAIRLALLTTKSFVYLWTAAKSHTPAWLRDGVRAFGRRLSYLSLLSLSPFYQVYRRAKKVIIALREHPTPWLNPLSHRYTLHAIVIMVAAVAIYANLTPPASAEDYAQGSLIFQLVESDVSFNNPEALTPTEDSGTPADTDDGPQPLLSPLGDVAFQPYLPTTQDSVAPRKRIEEYVVQNGDTPAGIAAKFHIQLSTLLNANNLGSRGIIKPGQKLTILPVDGLTHTVAKGDTLGAIAKRYQVTSESILSFNRLPNERSITAGQTLIVPGGKPPAAVASRPTTGSNSGSIPANVPRSSPVDAGTKLLWPTVSHRINQYFTYRHSGLDIHGTMGTAIYAAEDGVVLESRWGGDYGNMVLIKHDNGLITRYGHASKLLVSKGQRVTRGQTIMLMGSTGRSTGPHLHFEVQIGSARVNPLSYTR